MKNDLTTLKEQMDIIRRIAERGLGAAHNDPNNRWATDTFQHILDEIAFTSSILEEWWE